MTAATPAPVPAEYVTAVPPEDVPVPARLAHLAVDRHGRLVPWFVHVGDDGQPDHRVGRAGGVRDALRFGLCWMCGTPRGRYVSFLLGPMCVVNRVTAEPPCHLDCAVYAARVCPFLTVPRMRRRETGLPEERTVAGVMIERNPGAVAVWTTRTWRTKRAPGGVLFDIGDGRPDGLLWFAEGRAARRAEVEHALDTGLPILRETTQGDRDELAAIEANHARTLLLLPSDDGTHMPVLTTRGTAHR